MNILLAFELNQLRSRIALQEVLNSCHSELISVQCPFCQSEQTSHSQKPEQLKTYTCLSCQQDFSEEMLVGCRCRIPGELQKCQDCERYQSILPLLQERVAQLRSCSRSELEAIAFKLSL
jgi:ribosomal protein S27E